MAAISNAFSWMEIYEFRLKFQGLFLRVQLTNSNIGSDNGLELARQQAIV